LILREKGHYKVDMMM